MDDRVDVTIRVDAELAGVFDDARNRESIGRMVSRRLRPKPGSSALADAIAGMKAEARAGGLTDQEIDAEIEAYNAERRG